MYAFDVNGDGRNDVITSKAAHAYGLSWFENVAGKNGEITFKEHLFMGEKPEQNEYGVAFSQLHAIALADMDHDGVPDIITGKRFWAHAEHDPGSLEPAVLYWFQTVREPGGKARFIPHRIDSNSGVGTQVEAGDLNGDGWADIVVGNKKGTFVFIHEAKEVDKRTWQGGSTDADEAEDRRNPQPTRVPDDAERRDSAQSRPTGAYSIWTLRRAIFRIGRRPANAFEDQPIEGDTVHARRSDSVSGHKGKYWIGTYERRRRLAARHAYVGSIPGDASLRKFPRWRRRGRSRNAWKLFAPIPMKLFFKPAARASRRCARPWPICRRLSAKQIYFRVVDHGGAGWSHINFDHFRFHDKPPKVVERRTGSRNGRRLSLRRACRPRKRRG